MRIAIISDCYTPMKTSAAVMLEDLAIELRIQGHFPVVIVPDSKVKETVSRSVSHNVEVIRVSCLKTKDLGFIRRTLGEIAMPFIMLRRLRQGGMLANEFDGIIWYSPSIFHGPLVKRLKDINQCKGYLILRDIFPEWAVNLGIMGKGIPYLFFKMIERYQYSVADRIGVQTPSNIQYFSKLSNKILSKVEVLNNWMKKPSYKSSRCSISLFDGPLAGRKIFVYSGNMGKAQDIAQFIEVMSILDQLRTDIGFVFVGRGSEVRALTEEITNRQLGNVLIFDEIDHHEIPGLYVQCNFGMVFLDSRHKTHNIPGKFISYMHYGLPTLAYVNKGNDLIDIVRTNRLGYAFDTVSTDMSISAILEMIEDSDYSKKIPENCRAFARAMFSSSNTAKQITDFLEK
jgi:glycosyltransferase involved in cell wall biosynthesis